jgi:hypothetical protein
MAQVVVYGRRESLDQRRSVLSEAIHAAIMSALEYPPEKKFQRFIALDQSDFIYPEDRGADYTIIEISMFEGRTDAAKRALIVELFTRVEARLGSARTASRSPSPRHPRSTGVSEAKTLPI